MNLLPEGGSKYFPFRDASFSDKILNSKTQKSRLSKMAENLPSVFELRIVRKGCLLHM